jgi:hypothetical protein
MRYRYIIGAMAMLGFATQANAEIIALDCGTTGTPYSYNVWVDMDKSIVTVRGRNLDGSYPAQITPTTITWTKNYAGNFELDFTVDRTAGTIHLYIPPNPQGNALNNTDSCARGSMPFPATKF